MNMEGHGVIGQVPVEGDVLPSAWTFDMVQDRLVEALLTCWRHPDRERGWQRVRSTWPDVAAQAGDYDARGGDHSSSDVALRPAAMTRADVGEMEEAFGWLDALAANDRKLVGLAVAALARGQREVPWRALLARMGLQRGADGLRKRYGKAVTSIAARLNGGNARGCSVNGV